MLVKYFQKMNKNVIQLYKGDFLHTPNELVKSLSFLKNGKLKVVKYLSDGHEITVNYIFENQIFGESLLFENERYPAYIVAEERSVVWEVKIDEVLKLMKNESFLLEYISSISHKVSNLAQKVEMLSIKSAKERFARYIIAIYEKQRSTLLSIDFSKTKISKELCLSRETISRVVSHFKNLGILEEMEGEKLRICKLNDLERIAYALDKRSE